MLIERLGQGRLQSVLILATLSIGAFAPSPLAAQQTPLLVAIEAPPAADSGIARGVAWGDLDGDGYPELYVARSAGFANTLYHNDRGSLRPLRESPASIDAGQSEGAVFVDFDNDGDLDLHGVTRSGGAGLLFRNDGAGALTRVRGTPIAPDSMSASMACWADADRDGDLDVFIVGYATSRNQLFQNEAGGFRPVPLPAWMMGEGDGRACAWGDPNGDGYPDLAIAVARRPNLLLRNRGGFAFEQELGAGLQRDSAYSYGISWADADQDGRQDLFVDNFVGDNKLYRNLGGGRWEESPEGRVLESAASKGHAWGDYDLDGRLDLYLGSGTPEPNQRNVLYRRNPAGAWTAEWSVNADTAAGLAWADMEGDGDLDLFVANWGSAGSPGRLYRNMAVERDTTAGWITIGLRGIRSNRQAIGARVALLSGGRWQYRWLEATTGYAGANQAIMHFGLNGAAVDSLVIAWPSGTVDRWGPIEPRRHYRALEGRPLIALE